MPANSCFFTRLNLVPFVLGCKIVLQANFGHPSDSYKNKGKVCVFLLCPNFLKEIMSAQTVLLDLTIEPSRISDAVGQKDVVKLLEKGLLEYFPQIKLIFETSTSDGHLCVFSQHNTIFLNARFFNHGIITINIEYYKDDAEQTFVTFDVCIFYLECRLYNSKFSFAREKTSSHSETTKLHILCLSHFEWVLFLFRRRKKKKKERKMKEAYELAFN